MEYKRLYILIEGDDDERFFNKILIPILENNYDSINIWKYAQIKKEKIKNFIKSIKSMMADYICVSDINDSPCVAFKKEKIKNRFNNLVENDRIVVVIKEIESWYLAGLSNQDVKKLAQQAFSTTDNITKEQFDSLIPKKFTSRIDFMTEILKYFSIEIAKKKNHSFNYFLRKYV